LAQPEVHYINIYSGSFWSHVSFWRQLFDYGNRLAKSIQMN